MSKTKQINATPLHDRVIIQPMKVESKTSGGIIIPDTSKEKPNKGIVKAVGKGFKDEPMTVVVGDTVLYNQNTGIETKIDGEDYIMLREFDILAVLYY